MRRASEQEIVLEELREPKQRQDMKEILKKTTKVLDTTKEGPFPVDEPGLPDQPQPSGARASMEEFTRAHPSGRWQSDRASMQDRWSERRKRALERPRVDQEVRRWKQLISVNENRRREGLPPVTTLPDYPNEDVEDQKSLTQYFALDGDLDQVVSEEAYTAVIEKIKDLESLAAAMRDRNLLREQIAAERKDEKKLIDYVLKACDNQEEACFITWYIDDFKNFLNTGHIYAKQMKRWPES